MENALAEVLLEIGESKQVLKVSVNTIEAVVKSKLPGSSTGPYLLPFDSVPKTRGTFILQKWSDRWGCFVDFDKEVAEGDKLKVAECNQEVPI